MRIEEEGRLVRIERIYKTSLGIENGCPLLLRSVAQQHALLTQIRLVTTDHRVETSVDTQTQLVTNLDECTEVVPIGRTLILCITVRAPRTEPSHLLALVGREQNVAIGRTNIDNNVREARLLSQRQITANILLAICEIGEVSRSVHPDIHRVGLGATGSYGSCRCHHLDCAHSHAVALANSRIDIVRGLIEQTLSAILLALCSVNCRTASDYLTCGELLIVLVGLDAVERAHLSIRRSDRELQSVVFSCYGFDLHRRHWLNVGACGIIVHQILIFGTSSQCGYQTNT